MQLIKSKDMRNLLDHSKLRVKVDVQPGDPHPLGSIKQQHGRRGVIAGEQP
jgi:hypothetical protein